MTDTVPRIARVFDRVDPVTGPAFDPDHELLSSAEQDAVLSYLDAGATVLSTTERMADVRDPALGPVVPLDFRTDGEWIWTDSVAYFLRAHALAPDRELLAHIRDRNFQPPPPGPLAVERALAVLLAPDAPGNPGPAGPASPGPDPNRDGDSDPDVVQEPTP